MSSDRSAVRYVNPPTEVGLEDCVFYHRVDLPGIGERGDQWDLRGCVEEYLGQYDFSGKRVLDVGAASGFLTFEMERRGAEVVSFDMADGSQWDFVPRVDQPAAQTADRRAEAIAYHRRMQNGYWFLHRLNASRARVYTGDIYDLPAALGPFDVVLFGMILSHLRDPFRALESGGRLSRSDIIVTNQLLHSPAPVARFVPSRANSEQQAWWIPSLACLTEMLGVLGFEVERTVESRPHCLAPRRVGREITCTAVVARRR